MVIKEKKAKNPEKEMSFEIVNILAQQKPEQVQNGKKRQKI